jgi:[acyl-carrier-protein] S-malonyltransferase
MLKPWLINSPNARVRLRMMSQAAGWPPGRLEYLGTRATADEIRPTEIAQPLIVAAGLLALYEMAWLSGYRAHVVVGHSLGELTAAVAAGVLRPLDAVRLAVIRGQAMAEASALEPTGMTAVVGGDLAAVAAFDGLTVANYNLDPVPGVPRSSQIVVAGRLSDLERLSTQPPTGSRVVPLVVAGAFHTRFMEPAIETVRAAVASVYSSPPEIALLSNRHGRVVTDGAEFLDLLVSQMTAPVCWSACMRTMAELGVTEVVELVPANVLTGMVGRAMPGVKTLALRSPEDIARL